MSTQNIITNCEYKADITALNRHFHNTYQIILIKEGSANLKINDSSYLLSTGDLVFISYLEEHTINILSETYKRYFITLSPFQLDKLVLSPKLLSIFKNRPKGFSHSFNTGDAFPLIENTFKLLLNEYTNSDELSDDFISCTLNTLLINLYRKFPNQFPLYSKDLNPTIHKVQSYIEQHFAEDIKIAEFADIFFINPYYLTHIFKELTGYSPKQYLILTRLFHAKDLLVDTTLPINEIAYRSGFKDTNNFIRLFKSKFGITPLKYRQNITP